MARGEGFFDDLARGLADGSVTRGKALRLMGASLVGGALGSVGIAGEASADPPGCKRNGKNCKRDEQCCSGSCSSGTCQAQTTNYYDEHNLDDNLDDDAYVPTESNRPLHRRHSVL